MLRQERWADWRRRLWIVAGAAAAASFCAGDCIRPRHIVSGEFAASAAPAGTVGWWAAAGSCEPASSASAVGGPVRIVRAASPALLHS